MTSPTWGPYSKALGALFGFIVSGTAALSSLAFLSGPISHDLAVASAIAGALLVPLSTALSPENTPKAGTPTTLLPTTFDRPPPTAVAPKSRAESLAQEVRQFLADADTIRAALTGPVATTTYAPSPSDPSTVLAGVVTPPASP